METRPTQSQRTGVISPYRDRSIDVWSRLPVGFAPFIPETMKDDIAATGTIFLVLGCNLRTNTKFGPCWMVDVQLGDQNFTIPFSSADYRDDMMAAIRDSLREHGPFEATLRTFDTPNGHGWGLAEPDYEQMP